VVCWWGHLMAVYFGKSPSQVIPLHLALCIPYQKGPVRASPLSQWPGIAWHRSVPQSELLTADILYVVLQPPSGSLGGQAFLSSPQTSGPQDYFRHSPPHLEGNERGQCLNGNKMFSLQGSGWPPKLFSSLFSCL